MAFYDLSKPERAKLVEKIHHELKADLERDRKTKLLSRFSDEDTYIRKSAYLSVGRIYLSLPARRKNIIHTLQELLNEKDFKIRQTVVNAAGEIGMKEFETVAGFFDKSLFDEHHSVRNAVIGSMKKIGQKNPAPLLRWAKKYLHHPDKEIRREICHGIELRGRTHPQDILPLLKELQSDPTARVRNTLVHVLGQIAYKKGCLATVIADLKKWENKYLVAKAIEEIIDVHYRYRNFSALTQAEAKKYIRENF
ncbi:MAG TPA: sister chromatid cohesion protein PDS5 [Bacteroidia bacterium]